MAKPPKEQTTPPPAPTAAPWYRVAIASPLTYRNGWFGPDWINDLSMGNGKSFGVGWEKIVPHQRPELLGREVMDVLTKHDVVVTQHLLPPDFYRALRSHPGSRVKKALQWLDFEAVPAANYHSPLQKDLGNYMMQRTLQGTKPNRFLKMHVDPYETSLPDDGVGKPHCYCTNVRDTSFASGYMDIVRKMFADYAGLVNGVIWDNTMDRSYFGTASNAPGVAELEEQFVAHCRGILTQYRKTALGEIWGNYSAVQRLYPEIDTAWAEWDLGNSSNIAQLATNINAHVTEQTATRGRARGYVCNVQSNPFWLQNSQANWNSLASKLTVPGIGLVCFRAGNFALCPTQVQP